MQKVASSGESSGEAMAAHSILLVTVDQLIVANVGSALRCMGFEVLEASDCGIAIEACLTKRPSLVVIDD